MAHYQITNITSNYRTITDPENLNVSITFDPQEQNIVPDTVWLNLSATEMSWFSVDQIIGGVGAGDASEATLALVLAAVDGLETALADLNIDIDTLNLNTDNLEINTDEIESKLEDVKTLLSSAPRLLVSAGPNEVGLVVGAAPVSLAAIPGGALYAKIQNEGASDIRYTDDGVTVPAAGSGTLLYSKSEFFYIADLTKLSFVQETGSGAKLNITYYK